MWCCAVLSGHFSHVPVPTSASCHLLHSSSLVTPWIDELIVATADRAPVNARCMLDEKNGSMKAGGWVSSTAAAHTAHTGGRAEHTRGMADDVVVQAQESQWPA